MRQPFPNSDPLSIRIHQCRYCIRRYWLLWPGYPDAPITSHFSDSSILGPKYPASIVIPIPKTTLSCSESWRLIYILIEISDLRVLSHHCEENICQNQDWMFLQCRGRRGFDYATCSPTSTSNVHRSSIHSTLDCLSERERCPNTDKLGILTNDPNTPMISHSASSSIQRSEHLAAGAYPTIPDHR